MDNYASVRFKPKSSNRLVVLYVAGTAQADERFLNWLKQHGTQKGEEQVSAKVS